MSRCHKVQVVTFLLLQVHHHVGQAFRPHAVSQPSLAQGKILAVGAACLAIAEENRACSPRATDGWLLFPMDIPRSNNSLATRPAYTRLACDAITPAILRADRAATQNLPGGSGAFRQFACFIKVKIAGIQHNGNSIKKENTLSKDRTGVGVAPSTRTLTKYSILLCVKEST